MKKNKILFILFLTISLSVFSFDGGGLLRTGIGIDLKKAKDTDLSASFRHYDGISLWAKQSLDKQGNYNFSIQTSYLFDMSKIFKPKEKKLKFRNIVDVDLLKFSFLLPVKESNIYLQIGRFDIVDLTGIIFNQSLDGFFLSYETHKKLNFSTHFSLGYTGLLNSYTTAINGMPLNKKVTPVYNLAASFVTMTALFHTTVGKYKYGLDFEIDSFFETKAKGSVNNYFTFLANGSIYKNLFFIASASLEVRSRNKNIGVGGFLSTDFVYYFSKKDAKVGLKTQWLSGGKYYFEPFTRNNISKIKFTPITLITPNVGNTGLVKTELYASVKPVPELFLAADFNIMCTGKKNSKVCEYKGVEFNVSTNYIILSDIFVGFNAGMFIDEKNTLYSKLVLNVMLSF